MPRPMHGLIVRSFVDFAEERYPGDGLLTATSPPIEGTTNTRCGG